MGSCGPKHVQLSQCPPQQPPGHLPALGAQSFYPSLWEEGLSLVQDTDTDLVSKGGFIPIFEGTESAPFVSALLHQIIP